MPGIEPGLRLAGTVHRGDLTVAVELTAAPGEVVAILGPNGAGKSTLLRAVAGLEHLRTGRLTVGGDVLDDAEAGSFVPPRDRGVGTVFQDHRLFPHLSALENVAFGPLSHGVPRARAEERAAHWLDRLGVADLARRRPGALSGGQAQRVAVARALAAEPRALVLDEPLAALDAAARGEVQSALAEHLAAFTGPCLLVTHDLVDALVLADRVVALERGRVVQDAAPSLVAREPATGYLARLVGVNLLQGRRDGEQVHVAVPPAAVRLGWEGEDGWEGEIAGLTRWGDHVRVDVVARRSAVVGIALDRVVAHRPGSTLLLDVPSGARTVVEVPTADVTTTLRPGTAVRLTVRAPVRVYPR